MALTPEQVYGALNKKIGDLPVLNIDNALSTTSENAVQNKVVTGALDDLATFTGTTAQWNALTELEKGKYRYVNLTDDVGVGFTQNNAGFHNSVYRGMNLGTSVTAEQWAAIANGTFDDMFIGDYWVINGVNWRIAAFDYWLNAGDTVCTDHHVVIVPDTNLYNAKMNDSNITTGGYVGSTMRTTNLNTAKAMINAAFGSTHILSHDELLTNAVTDGKSSGWGWGDSTVDLMNESMAFGQNIWSSNAGYETGIDKTQLPLFMFRPDLICNRADWWLRCVSSEVNFALVSNGGVAASGTASNSLGVRPVFGIYQPQ